MTMVSDRSFKAGGPMRTLVVAALVLVAVSLTAGTARASDLVDSNSAGARLLVNRAGVALVLYRAHGVAHHTLYWGARNGDLFFAPLTQYDRSGGWKSHKADWRHFTNACRPYDGPALGFRVAACKAPDGSYWALQNWVRIRPNGGGVGGAHELRISHWTGPIAELWVKTDWSWAGQWQHLYGQLTYRGHGVIPGLTNSLGAVLDHKGRNVAIESRDSDFGAGWRRVNMFLANKPNGQFCYGFSPKDGFSGTGVSRVNTYRAEVAGPGVTPDLFTQFNGHTSPYDTTLDALANSEQTLLAAGGTQGSCSVVN
jgi:hypothetical protein